VFQLLVLLALLAILLGILLPLVAITRDRAAQASSQNNLKQIGLAVHNYVSVYNQFPTGNDANNFSTAAYLLPFIEQDNVFRQIDFKKPMDDPVNAAMRGVVIKTFLSPTDNVRFVKEDFGATNYLFNAGSKPGLKDNDGIFYQESKITFADITDGTSNTLMSGETLKGDGGEMAVTVARQHVLLKADAVKDVTDDTGVQDFKNNKHIAGDRCASWMDGRFLQGTFTTTRKLNDERPDVNCGGAGGLSALRSEEKRINVGMCDGSVRAVSPNIALEVWKALGTRNGGEVIPAF
jgi:prepilin-type processing-associated H-X9-DG protein